MNGMDRHRRLAESGQDQLQLAGIGGDVADGEDARFVGLTGRWIDDDVMVVEPEAPAAEA